MFDAIVSAFGQVWWSDWAALGRMGRHGVYVWPALGLTALALAGEWLALRRRAQHLTEQRCDDAADDVSAERHHP